MSKRIGLIDVDGHNYPNLPLMKISAWHKQQGDSVEWYDPWLGLVDEYDKVYMSKVFSFTPDYEHPVYAKEVQRGGSGYCIKLVDGKEIYDTEKDGTLLSRLLALSRTDWLWSATQETDGFRIFDTRLSERMRILSRCC